MCMLKEVLLMYRYCDLLFGRPVFPQSPSCPVWLPRAGPSSQDMAGRPPLSPAWGCGRRAGLLPWQHLPSSQIARTLSPPMNGEEGLTDRWGGQGYQGFKRRRSRFVGERVVVCLRALYFFLIKSFVKV